MDFELFDVFEGNETASGRPTKPASETLSTKRGREELESIVDTPVANSTSSQEPATVFTEHTEQSLSVTGSDRKITTVLLLHLLPLSSSSDLPSDLGPSS
jgi:hypothetical protein